MECPYDFIVQFDDWLYWQTCVIYWGLSEESSTQCVLMRQRGWDTCFETPISGGWEPSPCPHGKVNNITGVHECSLKNS